MRWSVAGKERKEPFKTVALADGFRSDLVAAARKGEAFDVDTGLPVSMRRAARVMSWYDLACTFVDMKWPRVAATTRRTHAEALTAVTVGMLASTRGKPDDKVLRKALGRWAFNTAQRDDDKAPHDVRAALRSVATHTRPVGDLSKPEVLRPLLDGLTVRLDGSPAATSVVSRRRKIFNTAVEYAVERKVLAFNPLPALSGGFPRRSTPSIGGRWRTRRRRARCCALWETCSEAGHAWWRSTAVSTTPVFGRRRHPRWASVTSTSPRRGGAGCT